MFRRLVLAAVAAALTGVLSASVALAGQPDQSCQAVFPTGPLTPAGFNTGGFGIAGGVYAGSGASLVSGNPMAVSQYDVACVQVASH